MRPRSPCASRSSAARALRRENCSAARARPAGAARAAPAHRARFGVDRLVDDGRLRRRRAAPSSRSGDGRSSRPGGTWPANRRPCPGNSRRSRCTPARGPCRSRKILPRGRGLWARERRRAPCSRESCTAAVDPGAARRRRLAARLNPYPIEQTRIEIHRETLGADSPAGKRRVAMRSFCATSP